MTDNARLQSFIERIETVNAEIAERQEDAKSIYAEAKSTGFDPKIMRKLVAIRKKRAEAVKEENELLSTYARELGMQLDFGL